MQSIASDTPKQKLVFYVAEDVDASVRSDVQQRLRELAASRAWSIAPPGFIDEVDENGLEIVGGGLEIYSALPPNRLPADVDQRTLEEVDALVEAVKALSASASIAFEFHLDMTYVGCIEDGVIDRVLLSGLLMPWREHLNRKR